MGTILDKIIETKRRRVDAAKVAVGTEQEYSKRRAGRFRDAFKERTGPRIVAEFKRASPSKGWINATAEPVAAALNYRDGGAAAISVLTEEDHFRGSLNDLAAIREAVDLPILRKDFIIDEFQIHESARAGADAILLIVAALSENELGLFHSVATGLGLDVLVEVHDLAEMEAAGRLGADLIGVNNRSLRTFEVSLDVSRTLINYAPDGAIMIAESGIRSRTEIEELSSIGYSGFLVGESLMRPGNAAAVLEGWI